LFIFIEKTNRKKNFWKWYKRDKNQWFFLTWILCKKQQLKKGACGCGIISKHVHILEKCTVI
jgi:hypothetical protein